MTIRFHIRVVIQVRQTLLNARPWEYGEKESDWFHVILVYYLIPFVKRFDMFGFVATNDQLLHR